MRKFYFMIALAAISLAAQAAIPAPKHIHSLRFDAPNEKTHVTPIQRVAEGSTYYLSTQINYVQGSWYTAGEQAYYTFVLTDYESMMPAIQIEVTSRAQVTVENAYTVEGGNLDLAFCSLQLDTAQESMSLTSARMTLTYEGRNSEGICTYTIYVEVVAEDGNKYICSKADMPIYAYDADRDHAVIELKERFTVAGEAEHGSISGVGEYAYDAEVTVIAVPDEGYHFDVWANGSSRNPITFHITEDTTFVAEFDVNRYNITVMTDGMGSVVGGGSYYHGEAVSLEAVPFEGYKFDRWSDGSTDNPYEFTASSELILMAFFKPFDDAIEDVITDANAEKIMMDGHLYILRDGKIYTVEGMEVK